MDTKSGVEFVALTKEEIEDMIAKAALAGARWRLKQWKKSIGKRRRN